MRSGKLRQAGGAVIVTLPKPFLDQLGLKADAPVDIAIVDGKIVIAPKSPGRIGLAARIAMCGASQPLSAEEREWMEAPAVGDEAI